MMDPSMVSGFRVFTTISLCIVIMCTSMAAAATKHYKWEVAYKHWSPDGIESAVMAINGQFPGPTIRAQAGDTISVELVNKLYTEGVVIHWHGIRQFGTPWADGTAAISQCPINAGESFTYRFTVDKPGTYFYHGHYGMQRSAGLYGSLIVDVAQGKKEPFHYDGEFNLLLSDWWHKSSHEQELDLSSKPFRWIGEPQSLLINGRGQFNCSLASKFSTSWTNECKLKGGEQNAPQILHVLPNKTYRLRITSSTAMSSLNFAVAKHKLVVVEADGNYVSPFTVDNIDLYSGDSYSVLFTTNQDPSQNYYVSITVRGREPKTPPGLTLLNYVPTHSSKFPSSPPSVGPAWDDYAASKAFTKKILAPANSPKPPTTYNRRIMLLNTQNKIDGYTKWAINNVTLSLPSTPYLGAIKYKIPGAFDPKSPPDRYPEDYDVMIPAPNQNSTYGNGVYDFALNTTVDVILQNANALKEKVSEIHPWHLHGHDFWLLGYGEGKFKDSDEAKFNLKNPPLRNTAIIYPYGWTALRFVIDNPGAWAFHCHIEPHLHMGMGVVFAAGIDTIPKIPDEALRCGLTDKMLMHHEHN